LATKKPKIIIDTNVIVAASILEKIQELNIEVSHKFYGQSMQLFSIFKKRPEERIGIATPKVRTEAFGVLSKAVKDTFIPEGLTDINRKRIFYDNGVGFVNTAERKMKTLFKLLSQPRPNRDSVWENLKQVKEMAYYLKNQWEYKYRGRRNRDLLAKGRSKNIKTEPYWDGIQKDEVFSTHRSQVTVEARQLEKFMRKWPNKGDGKILAETITIKQEYEQLGEGFKFYIASCDTGFFSPMVFYRGISNMITKEIEKRFDIVCDQPKVIFWIIEETL